MSFRLSSAEAFFGEKATFAKLPQLLRACYLKLALAGCTGSRTEICRFVLGSSGKGEDFRYDVGA